MTDLNKALAAGKEIQAECKAIEPALQAWFESQGIDPARRTSVLTYALAKMLAEKAPTKASLAIGCFLYCECLISHAEVLFEAKGGEGDQGDRTGHVTSSRAERLTKMGFVLQCEMCYHCGIDRGNEIEVNEIDLTPGREPIPYPAGGRREGNGPLPVQVSNTEMDHDRDGRSVGPKTLSRAIPRQGEGLYHPHAAALSAGLFDNLMKWAEA